MIAGFFLCINCHCEERKRCDNPLVITTGCRRKRIPASGLAALLGMTMNFFLTNSG